ncbi:MAG: phage portal protein [Bacillota bacterium]|nr:phage portal protein [Bacillota bacterium]
MLIFMDRERFSSLEKEYIKKIVKANLGNTRYGHLWDYYLGNHKILRYSKKNKSVPNNQIVNNIAKYITDTINGYFLGTPVIYNSLNEPFLAEIQKIYDYNDEQDHNMELAKGMSIFGSTFEMIYLDENADVRFTVINPSDVILIKSTDLKDVLGAIRFIRSRDKNDREYLKIEYWNEKSVSYYLYKNDNLEFVDEREHYFGDVPFVEYINNEERTGDYEGVITQIDAYNRVQSNTANMFQYNDEALLIVKKLGDVSDKDIAQMKEDGAVIFPEDGDMSWLLKTVDDTAIENYKKRIREDIHILSNVPNMADESFAGNLSGVAISYKLWAFEQAVAIKERKFKKALQRRIEIITNILNIKGGNFNYMEIDPVFRRNKPQNILETAQIISMLQGTFSQETLLSMMPGVTDARKEIEKLEKEKEKARSDFGITNFVESIEHKHE